MLNVKVRTRYAPSPTGTFHVGGARTALFNYLFAKHYHGDFIVRIEDTDTARNVSSGIESQLENLKWLNIFADESPLNPGSYGPYMQSEKLDVYRQVAKQLIAEGKAYYCFCDQATLERMRRDAAKSKKTPKYDRRCLNLSPEEIKSNLAKKIPFSIRIKIPDDRVFTWDDLIRGKLAIPSSSMNDIIIVKNNGIATYNFAATIDDIQMQITHVFRGEEHLTNTAYQLWISECIGSSRTIKYGHLSIITDFNGKKLSKRSGDVSCFIETYRDRGYLPDAIVNFLLLLGWSPPDGKSEIFSINDVFEIFDANNIGSAPTIFDVEKLNWINGTYIKKMSDASYVSFVEGFLKPHVLETVEKKDETLLLFKKQIFCASQINELIEEFFPNEIPLNNIKSTIGADLSVEDFQKLLESFLEKINHVTEWTSENIKALVNFLKVSCALSEKVFFHSLRFVLTGKTFGPEFAGIVYVLGRAKCDKLLKNALNYFRVD